MRVRTAFILVATASLSAAVAGCDSKSPTEPTPSCTATISPTSQSFDGNGGTASVTVSVAAGCSWSATSSGGWIAVTSGGSGSGAGTVAYSVAVNSDTQARNGTLTIAGQVHSVSQQGRPATVCSYTLSPTTATYNKDAADGTFAVTTPADCSWTATSSAAWLTFTAGERGAGSGSVSYRVARNGETTDRTATINVADQMFTVRQAGDTGGCQYSVAPVDINLCMAGGTVTTAVTTQANCTWTAAPDVAWLSVSGGSSGTGSGVVTVTVSGNYDAPRSGTVLVRWPTPTLGQNVRIAQAGCRYAVSKTAIAFPAGGGSNAFDVIQQSDPTECGGATQDRCVWSAVADVPWITITSSMPRSGDNPVSFTVSPNAASDARVGTITVRDKVVLITQAGK
jgi:Viral BACON domain/Putative binding domain, N-terminal